MSTTEVPGTQATVTVPVPEKKKSEPRDYVVLQKVSATSPSAGQVWAFARNVKATSAEGAIRQAAELIAATSDEDSFTLVAVPARNFKPVTVSPEIQTKLKFS